MPIPIDQVLAELGPRPRVLVVRLGALGDIVRTVPAVRLIRRSLPQARLVWALESHWSVVLDGHPDLDALVPVPRKQLEHELRSPARWWRLARTSRDLRDRLRAGAFDLVLDFHGNLRSGLVARASGARFRVGYDGHQQKEGNRWLSTHRVPSGDRRAPRMERNLDLIRALGLPDGPLPVGGLALVERGRDAARAILASADSGSGGFAVIAPGVSRAQSYKKPPAELLAAACRRLVEHSVVPWVVHGPGEEDDARSVVEASGGAGRLAPPTDLPALTALLAEARLFVGGDTGPMHLACAVGCPVLALYGPTDPQVNRPWGVPHRAVHPPGRRYTGIKRADREAGGFEGLTAWQVETAVEELLPER